MRNGITLILMLALLLTACTAQPSEPVPPKIHYGEDICSDCGMIINEPRFAGAYAVEQEPGRFESFVFDDIGDLLLHMYKNKTLKGVDWWVHDYHSEEWIDAPTAFYVLSNQIKTPMGYGIAAFAEESAAKEFAAGVDGKLLSWDDLRNRWQ